MAKKREIEGMSTDMRVPDRQGNTSLDSSASIKLDLSPLEKEILDIAQELMQKHYIIIISDLYAEANRKIKNENKIALLSAINGLIRKKIIFEGKALTKESIMNNQTRKAVYNLILAEPGIHFSKIRSILQKDTKTIALHLGILQRFDLIRSKEFDNNIVYFDRNLGDEFDVLYYYIHKKNVFDMFKVLIQNPGISFDDLFGAIVMETTRGNMLRKINILIEMGFLSAMRDANQIISLQIHSRYLPPIMYIVENMKSM